MKLSETRQSRSIEVEWQAGLVHQMNHSLQAQVIQFCASAKLQITTCHTPVGRNPSLELEFRWELILNTNVHPLTSSVNVFRDVCVGVWVCVGVLCLWGGGWEGVFDVQVLPMYTEELDENQS